MSFFGKFKKKFYFIAAGYFRFFADFSLRRWNPRIVALTGSAGKTTMLHIVEFELEDKAHYSHDANSAFGVAFDILGLKGIKGSKLRWLYLILATPFRALFFTRTEPFYVVEIDGERPRETDFLASWLRPEITLWISLGRSHAVQFDAEVTSGKFASLDDAIAAEFSTLPKNTTSYVFIDADNPLMQKYTQHLSATVLPFSKTSIKSYSVSPDKTVFKTPRNRFIFSSPQPRSLSVQILMMEQLAIFLGISLKTNLSAMPLPPSRSSFFLGQRGIKLIDSTYNAHMISMQSVLEMFRDIKYRPKWLVIGDIVEQGASEATEHARLADLISTAKPDRVILVGRRTREYTYPLLTASNKPSTKPSKKSAHKTPSASPTPPVDSFLSPKEALTFINQHITGNELILFKGSQYLEWLVEKLLQDPADAALLCRRDPGAVKRRKNHGLE